MRLSQQHLLLITGRQQPAAQCRWFKNHFGVTLPADAAGPILTEAAFNALVAKSAGVLMTAAPNPDRPSVRLRKAT